jgi:hypothetical protein
VKELCPGVEYNVTVKYPEARRTLLTTTQGEWAASNATCPGRMYTPKGGKSAKNFTAVLTIPCNTTGEARSPPGCFPPHPSKRMTKCCWCTAPCAACKNQLCIQAAAPSIHLAHACVPPAVVLLAVRLCAAASTILQVSSASSPSSAFKQTSMQVSDTYCSRWRMPGVVCSVARCKPACAAACDLDGVSLLPTLGCQCCVVAAAAFTKSR